MYSNRGTSSRLLFQGADVCAPISLYILLNEESRITSILCSKFLMEPKSSEDYLNPGNFLKWDLNVAK